MKVLCISPEVPWKRVRFKNIKHVMVESKLTFLKKIIKDEHYVSSMIYVKPMVTCRQAVIHYKITCFPQSSIPEAIQAKTQVDSIFD